MNFHELISRMNNAMNESLLTAFGVGLSSASSAARKGRGTGGHGKRDVCVGNGTAGPYTYVFSVSSLADSYVTFGLKF